MSWLSELAGSSTITGGARSATAWTSVWFLAVDSAVRERRLVRRRQLFGHSVAEAHSWVASVDEKNATITDPTRTRADLVVHLFTPPGHVGSGSSWGDRRGPT